MTSQPSPTNNQQIQNSIKPKEVTTTLFECQRCQKRFPTIDEIKQHCELHKREDIAKKAEQEKKKHYNNYYNFDDAKNEMQDQDTSRIPQGSYYKYRTQVFTKHIPVLHGKINEVGGFCGEDVLHPTLKQRQYTARVTSKRGATMLLLRRHHTHRFLSKYRDVLYEE